MVLKVTAGNAVGPGAGALPAALGSAGAAAGFLRRDRATEARKRPASPPGKAPVTGPGDPQPVLHRRGHTAANRQDSGSECRSPSPRVRTRGSARRTGQTGRRPLVPGARPIARP